MKLPPAGISLSGAPDDSVDTSHLKERNKDLLLVTIPSDLRDAIRDSSQNGRPPEFIAGKVPVSADFVNLGKFHR